MECRTKAAINIIAGLTKKEAFELFDLIRVIEKKFKENGTSLALQSLDRETTVTFVNDTINEWIKTGELKVPPYLNNSFKSFIKLMVNERVQLDKLVFEYNHALCPLLQYDLFKEDKKMADTVEDAERLAKEGEKLTGKGFVKTDGFEKTVAFLMQMTKVIWEIMQENKSFRMELFYDTETLNTNYYFFTPANQCVSDEGK